MALTDALPIGFMPTCNAEAARTFFEDVLGLSFLSDDGFAAARRQGEARQARSLDRLRRFPDTQKKAITYLTRAHIGA